MEVIQFDRQSPLPIIDARIYGPRKSHKVRLVFDTGAQFSIIDTGLIEDIGYSARDARHVSCVLSASGASQDGYLLEIKALGFFGRKRRGVFVGAFDFEHFVQFGANGLLGFDLIKQLHLELDGPHGVLKIF